MDFRGQSGVPLGLANNNPGDLRTGQSWLGTAGSYNGFLTFTDDTWGLRALAYDLTNKYNNDGLITITQIISKYAPPSENDTAAYISSVCSDMGGIDANTDIGLNANVLASLMRAIINHELGNQYSAMISDADIQTGISMIPTSMLDTLGQFFEAGAGNPGVLIATAVILLALTGYYVYRVRKDFIKK